MGDGADLRRVELSVALLGLTVIAAAAPITVDGFRFHLEHLATQVSGHDLVSADCLIAVLTALGSTVAIVRFFARLGSLAVRQHRLLSRLRQAPGPQGTTILDSPCVHTFTAGFLRPRIYVSRGSIDRLAPAALTAIIEHEACHARRRDPLRLAIACSAAHALGWIPGLSVIGRRQAAVAELAADAHAVRRLGDVSGLADALLAADERAEPGAGVLPQRVDQLAGDLRYDVSPVSVRLALAMLGVLTAASILMAAAADHPTTFCAVAAAALAPLALLPAGIAARRGGRLLDLR